MFYFIVLQFDGRQVSSEKKEIIDIMIRRFGPSYWFFWAVSGSASPLAFLGSQRRFLSTFVRQVFPLTFFGRMSLFLLSRCTNHIRRLLSLILDGFSCTKLATTTGLSASNSARWRSHVLTSSTESSRRFWEYKIAGIEAEFSRPNVLLSVSKGELTFAKQRLDRWCWWKKLQSSATGRVLTLVGDLKLLVTLLRLLLLNLQRATTMRRTRERLPRRCAPRNPLAIVTPPGGCGVLVCFAWTPCAVCSHPFDWLKAWRPTKRAARRPLTEKTKGQAMALKAGKDAAAVSNG